MMTVRKEFIKASIAGLILAGISVPLATLAQGEEHQASGPRKKSKLRFAN